MPGSDARTDTIEIVALGKPIELRVALEGTPPPAQIRIGSKTPASDSDFVATIRPAVRFHVGDQAKFDVRIQNRGSSPAFLVRRVDGSSSPAVWIAIVGPPQGLYEVGRTLSGNSNGVQAADFVEVLPGASFDPFKGSNLAHGRFNAPGRYTATFRYMTTNTAPAMWQDDSCQRCDVSEEMRALLERVPMLDLIALITFEVEP